MEIGNEISQKIRSAIKAKLVDLGAYVDDELPDYIMVMVANKKTKDQMTEDLNLFLGTHTDKFTAWLHNLLCKLQAITADLSGGEPAKEDHGEPTPEEKDLLASADQAKNKTAAVPKTAESSSASKEATSKESSSSTKNSSKSKDTTKPHHSSTKDAKSSRHHSSSGSKDSSKPSHHHHSHQSSSSKVKDKDKARGRTKSTSMDAGEKSGEKSVEKSGDKSGDKDAAVAKEDVAKEGASADVAVAKEAAKQEVVSKDGAGIEKKEETEVEKKSAEESEEDQPEINLRPEHDEFEEDIVPEPEKPKSTAQKPAEKPASDKVGESSRGHESRSHESRSHESRSHDRGRRSPDKSLDGVVRAALKHMHEKKHGSSERVSPRRAIKRSADDTGVKTDRGSLADRLGKKHRSLSSRIGAVITHDVYTSEDEYDPYNPSVGNVASVIKVSARNEDEYDPYNPSVGNVASVIKVSARKSSIPAEMQPNKSILLKAMKDAQKSVEIARQKTTAKAVVRPMQREMHGDRTDRETGSVRSRLGVHREPRQEAERPGGRRDERREDRWDRRDSREWRDRKRGGRARSADSHGEMRRKRRRSEPRETGPRPGSDEEYVIGVASSSRGDEYIPSRISRSNSADKYAPDRREVEIIIPGASQGSQDSDSVDFLLDSEDEKATNEREPRRSREGHRSGDRQRSTRSAERETSTYHSIYTSVSHAAGARDSVTPSPTFVVTLDGVDPVALKEEARLEPQVSHEDDRRFSNRSTTFVSDKSYKGSPTTRNVGRVKPTRVNSSGSLVAPVTINLSEDESEEPLPLSHPSAAPPAPKPPATPRAPIPLKQLTPQGEKCRFFPACKAGNQCPYIHPTTTCAKFPNCHFGDRCLYIHPQCKFDAQCTRPVCAFSHTVKKQAVTQPTLPVILQPIRVPMYVPRPPMPQQFPVPRFAASGAGGGPPGSQNCRFYPKCTNMDCTFRHPKPCRYGIACTNKATCFFFHPTLPSAEQLKWTPQTKPASSGALSQEV